VPAVAGNAQETTFINVEGKKVHYVVTEGKSPAVVFVSGLGEACETWEQLQKALHGLMTISYDRPGLGLSAPAEGRRDATTLARELHYMLAALKVKPPYVLVGHSPGGAVVQIYANFYP
jgi:pimeloyl-ACP methyl ester carboxylesterase